LRDLVYRTGLTVSAKSGICYNTAIELPEDAAMKEAPSFSFLFDRGGSFGKREIFQWQWDI
jgi:hypothetical protein